MYSLPQLLLGMMCSQPRNTLVKTFASLYVLFWGAESSAQSLDFSEDRIRLSRSGHLEAAPAANPSRPAPAPGGCAGPGDPGASRQKARIPPASGGKVRRHSAYGPAPGPRGPGGPEGFTGPSGTSARRAAPLAAG